MRLEDFKLEVYFDCYEFNARHLMAQSDCQAMTVEELLALEPQAELQLQKTWLGYTEVAGDPELRDLVAAQYQGLTAEDVLMHCGAEEAIFAYMNVTLQPGDRVICLMPAYQSLFEIARAIGAEVVPWQLRNVDGRAGDGVDSSVDSGAGGVGGSAGDGAESSAGGGTDGVNGAGTDGVDGNVGGRWEADFDELAELITAQTRLIVINTPNNPTGFTFSSKQIDQLIELASTYDISIFSDEVYRGLNIDGHMRPALAEVYDKAVTLGVLSKAHGLAGLRVGWLVGKDHGLLAQVQRYKHYLSICSSSVSETLAKIALRHGPELIAANLAIICENVELANAFFARRPKLFANNPPQCGSVAFHRLKRSQGWKNPSANSTDNDTPAIEVFCERLVQDAGVLLLPGSLYGYPGDYFRMGYGRRDFPEALAALEAYVEGTEFA